MTLYNKVMFNQHQFPVLELQNFYFYINMTVKYCFCEFDSCLYGDVMLISDEMIMLIFKLFI